MIERSRPDLFGRVPSRFRDALKQGAATLEQIALGAYLALECYLEGGSAIFTIVGLKEECTTRRAAIRSAATCPRSGRSGSTSTSRSGNGGRT